MTVPGDPDFHPNASRLALPISGSPHSKVSVMEVYDGK
jgi:hypothetical protein